MRQAVLRALGLGAWVLCAAPALAGDIVLDLPVACTLGESCYIQHYLDRDPGPGAGDFGCGSATYEGHDGTDFALPTLADMARGVAVLAAAPGRVRAVRDGEADGAHAGGADVGGKECGNGVVIDHEGGWQTQYCHLKQGSVTVRPGQELAAGAPLGQVGMSGLADFPHLHLALRRDGEDIDPFLPEAAAGCTMAPPQALWRSPLPYVGGGLLQIGLSGAAPDYAQIKAGRSAAPAPATDAPALILWAYGFDSRAGDVIGFDITGPGGFAFSHEAAIEKPQALFLRYGGKRAPPGGFAPGLYRATVRHLRAGAELDRQEIALSLSR